MIFLAGEVAFPLHGAIVLSFGLIQYDAHPFPRGKEGGADIGDSTTLTLPYHLHYRANLGEEREQRQEDERLYVSLHWLIEMCLLFSNFFLSHVCIQKRPTFGGLLLSTVPALLILLISGLVSWKIWEKSDGEMWEREIKGRLVTNGK